MKSFPTRNLIAASCLLAAAAPLSSVMAQAVPNADDTIEVTNDGSTWLQQPVFNAIDIPAGANGVVINNGLGGVITSGATAIRTEAQTTINNAGTLRGTLNAVDFVNGLGSGTLSNFGSGVVSSDSRAVNIGGPVVLSNFGQILGTGNQRNGTIYSNITANNFSIFNQFGGLVDAGVGNLGAGFSAELSSLGTNFTLTNAGSLVGRGNAAAGLGTAGDGIRLERTRVGGALDGTTSGLFTGTISNTGSITSEGANGTVGGFRAVNGVSFQGTLDNSGDIFGVQNGVYFGNPIPAGGGDHTGGVVNNSGSIRSDSRAFNLDGIGLTVNNSGQILGTGNQRNGTLYADGTADDYTINNLAGGSIDAGLGNEGSGFGAEIGGALDGATTFALNNAGTIQGRGNAGAAASGAGDGVRIGNVGNIGVTDATIVNSGLINSEGANGTVAGVRFVNGISFQGTLTNAQGGVISGVQNGLYFGNPVDGQGADHTGGVVNNAGVISSDSRALNIDGLGLTVNNAGQILGTGNQRNGTTYADGTADDYTVNNLTGGVIDAGAGNEGSGFGVEIGGASDGANTFVLNNAGSIQGRGNAGAAASGAGDGVRVGNVGDIGTAEVQLNNSGVIASEGANGTVAGVRFVNGVSFSGQLNNSGTIAGVQNGLYFGNPVNGQGADHSNGVVNNTGIIRSDSRALNVDGNGLTVNNNGGILATGRQRNGTLYVDGTADNFTINNQFAGRIDARGGAGSGVSIQVGSFDGDVQNGSINNAGLIAGSGDQPVDAGVRLFTNAANATFTGDINNQFGGTITADAAPAILIQEGVTFAGNLVNNGTIDGAVSFASAQSVSFTQPQALSSAGDVYDVVLGGTSRLVLDIAGLLDFETFEVPTHDLAFGGVLQLNFVDDFAPQVGDSFDLFDFASSTGQFSAIQADDILFDTSALNSTGVLTVAAVPEPASLTLLAMSGAMLCRRRRSN